jgi:thiamine-monophosphate kinase
MPALGEFELIERFFTRPARRAALGVGDDCALIQPTPGMTLAVSCDMLIEGRHFVSTVAPERLGHKALAVNLSDLAACGAKPLAFTLSLALPSVDEPFLEGFARGLFALAEREGCELIGGDTTRGPLAICITVLGELPPGSALLRSGARPGDDLYVRATLGDARLALEVFRGKVALDEAAFRSVRQAMETPTARIGLGLALRGLATSAIDVSDGLVGDLGHILSRSGVGAVVEIDAVPRSAVLAAQPLAVQHECLLTGGDDYELLFTALPERRDAVAAAAAHAAVVVTRIGHIESGQALRIVDRQGKAVTSRGRPFDHFRS